MYLQCPLNSISLLYFYDYLLILVKLISHTTSGALRSALKKPAANGTHLTHAGTRRRTRLKQLLMH